MIPIRLIRVVDGDTIQVMLRGVKETVRLHSVDTEESAIGYGKPATAAGIRAKHYTREMCQSGELSLSLDLPRFSDFSREKEEEAIAASRDIYGRLIGHIYIDGETHLNAELIRLGFSPYFNKYGDSRVYDSRLRNLQSDAQRTDAMIWNKEINAGGAWRNYEKLLPWWETRAAAVTLARVSKAKILTECDNKCLSFIEYPGVETFTHAGGKEGKGVEESGRWRGYRVNLVSDTSKLINKSSESDIFLLDFQGGLQTSFSKGAVVHCKLDKKTKKLVRFWFKNDRFSQNPILKELVETKDYGFVSGFRELYRGIPQVKVLKLAKTPFDVIS